VHGKDDVLTAYDKNVLNVARRNDKLRDVFQRRWHPLDVFAARRQYGHNALRSE